MQYPTRHKSHVIETESVKRLDQCIPEHWIVRYATERDYGIDLLVEPVSHAGGPVEGHLFALQIKGTGTLEWNRTGGTTKTEETVFSGTQVATVNYWMGLPVPVFLCVHERTSGSVFVASVKEQVRQHYCRLSSQKTFGFKLQSTFDLSLPHAELLLWTLYVKERAYPHFAGALIDLLMNRDAYLKYIEENLGRDHFLEVESPEVVSFFRLYQTVQTVSDFVGIKWNAPSLRELIQDDQHAFGHKGVVFHELTHDRGLRLLAPIFLSAIDKACMLVQKTQRDFWKQKELLLFYCVSSPGTSTWISGARKRLGWVSPPHQAAKA